MLFNLEACIIPIKLSGRNTLTNLEHIQKQLRTFTQERQKLEGKLSQLGDSNYFTFKAKNELKNLIGNILISKYYYYIEENKNVLPKKELNVFFNLFNFINDEPNFINELMKMEMNYYNYSKSNFLKSFIENLIFNLEQQFVSACGGGEYDEMCMNEIINYKNSDESKDKIQTVINYFEKKNITRKNHIQNILLAAVVSKYRHIEVPRDDIDSDDVFNVLMILQKNEKENNAIQAHLLKFEVLYNLLTYLRLTC